MMNNKEMSKVIERLSEVQRGIDRRVGDIDSYLEAIRESEKSLERLSKEREQLIEEISGRGEPKESKPKSTFDEWLKLALISMTGPFGQQFDGEDKDEARAEEVEDEKDEENNLLSKLFGPKSDIVSEANDGFSQFMSFLEEECQCPKCQARKRNESKKK